MSLLQLTSFIQSANATLLRHRDAPINVDDVTQLLEMLLQLQTFAENGGKVHGETVEQILQIFDTIGCFSMNTTEMVKINAEISFEEMNEIQKTTTHYATITNQAFNDSNYLMQ